MSGSIPVTAAVRRDLARLVALVERERPDLLVLRDAASDDGTADPIASWLYRVWYSVPPEPVDVGPACRYRPDLASALRASLAAARRWTGGWVVLHVAPGGVCVAGRRGLTRTVVPGEYACHSRPGVPVAPGDALAITDCVSWVDWPTGFWTTQSSDPPIAPYVRMYVSADAAVMPRVLAIVTDVLDALALRYSLKCPVWPSGYARVDTLVLYLERPAWDAARDALMAVARELERCTRPWWPPLTLRLAPGVAYADDPGNGESFGQSRCRMLSSGVRLLVERPELSGDQGVGVLVQALVGAGLDAERPWLNGKG